ncbi:helix-turn-helix domain-containing protein [Pelosinus propionicus]|uniref:Helix-turn-helix domain-containing protein n=1 Tax=Pelosinus propionicus DSM 13327 TaxID=1123291 RepID=A0A1I4LIT5_9FIRM|nr:helix-turn-helix transcriptional regulator [Pelosinus propionicus]SFL90925.1 Helix-turn-helix domain-containing protein [Pelosinus propionicus DSM 13327]
MDNIGATITYFREQAGISKNKLAQLIEVDASLITRIEKNEAKPSFDSFFRICEALSISPAEFFATETKTIDPSLSRLTKAAEQLTEEERNKFSELINLLKK